MSGERPSESQRAEPTVEDHAVIGDCQTAALVCRDGTIDWWCVPRFDGRAAFAALLDPRAGHWSITPIESYRCERSYVPRTMVLETTFTTASGRVRVTDALSLGTARGHDIGCDVPSAIVRSVEGLDGEVALRVELVVRPEYGLVTPTLVRAASGAVVVEGGPDRFTFVADRPLELYEDRVHGVVTVGAGETASFALRYGAGDEPPPAAAGAVRETVEAWRSWDALHEDYAGYGQEAVRRSALVLQALTYQPTGAVIAAPTTSLPEVEGGSANWDYRYAWLRDASFTVQAQWVGACPDEAARYFGWMASAAGFGADGSSAPPVQIMYGVGGERDLTEHELDHLEGYGGARPVRIGNDAWKQSQLDVPGEVLDAAWRLRDQLGDLDPRTARFLLRLADVTAERWREEDAGLWEGREGTRHYVSSKVLCWVALDRAVQLAPRLGDGADAERWAAEATEVRRQVLHEGWHDGVGAYTGAYGSDHLDASVLLLPLVGFLDATDERMRATIDVVERELPHDGLVRRWTGAEDGAFVICSYWLADCLARAGEVDRARWVFERVTSCANDVGLLAEEIDPVTGRLRGNFPQGLSHVGLVNAAASIDRALTTG